MKKISSLIAGIFAFLFDAFAQDDGIEMADGLYASGKIYIVLISVLIILVGLLLYLIGLDRKVSKIEREMNENNR